MMKIANSPQQQIPHFRVLSEQQCHELYQAALDCMERVGVLVHSPEALELLAGAGVKVNGSLAHIPKDVIQRAIKTAPRAFTICGRDDRRQIRVSPFNVHFGPGPTCTYFTDPYTGERRKARRGDAGLTAKVCDALENIDFIMGLSLFDDVTPVLSPVYEFAESLENTGKPILAWANNPQTLEDIYRMAIAVAGSTEAFERKPFFGFFATYELPLRHPKENMDNLLWAVDHSIPVAYLGGPTVGMESPFTGASALVLYLATVLSGVAILQLKRPGAPIAVGGLPSPMDLRTARPAYGSPEMNLHVAASAELAHYLNLPFMGTAGASESKVVDAQAGAEAALQIYTSALSGASLVHDLGFLDCADIGSLTYLVLIDEIIAMVRRIIRGIPVNAETIMFDLLEKIGPGGSFLTEPSSVALCRSEVWVPGLMDRSSYVNWEKKGSKDTALRAQEKLIKILASHKSLPLDAAAREKIQTIVLEAEEREARTFATGIP